MNPIVEVGKSYSFKTLTFYYIGTVTAVYQTHARLKDCTEVYETGSNAEYYRGTIRNHERVPDGTLVPLNGGVVIMPWEHVIR